jgi:hypothetical protein
VRCASAGNAYYEALGGQSARAEPAAAPGGASGGDAGARQREHAALVIQQAVRCHAARLTYYMLLGIEADFGGLSPPDSGRGHAEDTGPQQESQPVAAAPMSAQAPPGAGLPAESSEAPAAGAPQHGPGGCELLPAEAFCLPAVGSFQPDEAAVRVDMAACTLQCAFRCYLGKWIPDFAHPQ